MHKNNLKRRQIITFLSELSSVHDSTNILCFKNDIAQKCVIYAERKKERKKKERKKN